MAWTNWGFDGTINEAQWAQMAGLLGNGYVAAGNGDCAVTAVSGQRKVSVAAGTLFGDGVVSVNSGAEEVTLTTPANGQWYVIALRRTWASNTAALVAVAGATTTTTTPTSAPTSLPTLNTNTGVLTDQPIAWAWCNSANTTVVVFDMRQFPVRTMPPTVASAAVRDAKYTSPTQGLQVWRDDLGATQTYYGLYNSSTNPGGRDTAGWYTNERQNGLVPIKPTTATIATGTGSANSIGLVSFSGATSITLGNVFTSDYSNYHVKISYTGTSNDGFVLFRFGTEASGIYLFQNARPYGTTVGYVNNTGTGTGMLFNTIGSGYINSTSADIYAPYKTEHTRATWIGDGSNGIGYWFTYAGSGRLPTSTSYSDLVLFPSGGNITGTVQVFGWNEK